MAGTGTTEGGDVIIGFPDSQSGEAVGGDISGQTASLTTISGEIRFSTGHGKKASGSLKFKSGRRNRRRVGKCTTACRRVS